MSGQNDAGTVRGSEMTDTLLGGRVTLMQPTDGYRAAIDPVLLAASVPATGTDHVLDVGCGVAAAALCLATRVGAAQVTGIEIQPELAELAQHNAGANGMGERVRVVENDLMAPRGELAANGIEAGGFDHVMANPPYTEAGRGTPPPDASKAIAHMESDANLKDWVDFCVDMVKPKGSVTFIHRAERLDDLLAAMAAKLGAVVVYPLWPRAGVMAKRLIVQGIKGRKTPLSMAPGLVLHGTGAGYTKATDAVLRDGRALDLRGG